MKRFFKVVIVVFVFDIGFSINELLIFFKGRGYFNYVVLYLFVIFKM